MLLAALAGCAVPPPPPPPKPVPPPVVLPPHAGPAPAASCHVAPFSAPDGATVNVEMQMINDGGYCAATLTDQSGKFFDAPLVTVMPQNGTPAVWKYNGKESVEYVPNPGFAGLDGYSVRLKLAGKPMFTTLNLSVRVQIPANK